MDFPKFRQSLRVTSQTQLHGRPWSPAALTGHVPYRHFAASFAGCTFNEGLYRVHDAGSGQVATGLIREAFPDVAGEVTPVAFDWLGRQIALRRAESEGERAHVTILDAGAGEVLEAPLTFEQFHEHLIPESPQDAVAASFYAEWRASSASSDDLRFDECVSYSVPLFLGGEDTVANLSRSSIAVDWYIAAELLRALREGRPITGISISDDLETPDACP